MSGVLVEGHVSLDVENMLLLTTIFELTMYIKAQYFIPLILIQILSPWNLKSLFNYRHKISGNICIASRRHSTETWHILHSDTRPFGL